MIALARWTRETQPFDPFDADRGSALRVTNSIKGHRGIVGFGL